MNRPATAGAEIPTHEIDLVYNTVTRALELAGRGYPAHGYWELIYGRERTRLDLGEGSRGRSHVYGPGVSRRGNQRPLFASNRSGRE